MGRVILSVNWAVDGGMIIHISVIQSSSHLLNFYRYQKNRLVRSYVGRLQRYDISKNVLLSVRYASSYRRLWSCIVIFVLLWYFLPDIRWYWSITYNDSRWLCARCFIFRFKVELYRYWFWYNRAKAHLHSNLNLNISWFWQYSSIHNTYTILL